MTLYNQSAANKKRTWILMTTFFLMVIGLGYLISWYFDSPEILAISVILSIVSSFVSYWWSDKIVLKMAGAHPVDPKEDKELYRLVENLCISAGLPVPKIYIIEDIAPNAFATGRNPENAAIAFTTGLLQRLEKSEIEGVAAHELSHIGNRDILIATIATVLVGTIVMMIDLMSRGTLRGVSDNRENKNTGAIGLIVVLVLWILAPLSAQLMQLAISRKREFLADSSAALITRYPEGLARALEKISADPHKVQLANRATAHMYIASPLKEESGRKTSWLTKMFMTHPPIAERVARLRGLDM